MRTASPQQVKEALDSSARAQKEWSAWTNARRGGILIAAADILDEYNDQLAELEAFDTGRPISETRVVDIKSASDCFRYMGARVKSFDGQYTELPNGFCYVRREPLGITAGIGAWNYPIQGMAWKAAPSLAAGNSFIFKPSEETPLTALMLAQAVEKAGAPQGLLNVMLGSGEIGKSLAESPEVSKISFTGSVPTGTRVAVAAAAGLKKCTLEMGGKSPLIVMKDANTENAARAAMMGNFYSNGEVCSNSTRVFLEKSIVSKFLDIILKKTKALKIGEPLDENTHVGPLISEKHLEVVEGYVATIEREGGEILCGGVRPQGWEKGFYFEPTIVTGLPDHATISREEIFGPVMCVYEFDTPEEAVERANNTEFGLAAGVFTKDISCAHKIASELRAGNVWINNYNLTPVEVPWGGHKKSGIGFENGPDALLQWTQPKAVHVELGDVEEWP